MEVKPSHIWRQKTHPGQLLTLLIAAKMKGYNVSIQKASSRIEKSGDKMSMLSIDII
jgi:hypothetical protein